MIVASGGSPGGYAWGLMSKRRLLRVEGIEPRLSTSRRRVYTGGARRKIAEVLARMRCRWSEVNARPTRFAPVTLNRGKSGRSNR